MTIKEFDFVYGIIERDICKQNTQLRKAISTGEEIFRELKTCKLLLIKTVQLRLHYVHYISMVLTHLNT